MAWGQAVITLPGGQVSLGIASLGQLGAGSIPSTSNNTSTTGGGYSSMSFHEYGIYLTSQNADGIAPGCFCEGWGVSANGVAGYAGNQNGGTSNLSSVSFNSTASTATSVVNLTGATLQVTQAYAPTTAPGASNVLFVDTVTLTNTGASALTDVRYARSMDWDINPTEFNEYITVGGLGANALLFSNDDGFCTPNPLATGSCAAIVSGTSNVNFTKLGPADQGSFFSFGFGNLAAGASKTFYIYYGAGANEATSLGALTAIGAEVYTLGYASNGTGGTANINSGVWAFGFKGVGGTPIGGAVTVPTLSTWGLGLLALLMIGAAALKLHHGSAGA